MRSLCTLSGGIGRFVPCAVGANHCRLRLLQFPYPPRSAPALLGGALPLKYCAVRFASRVSAWRLPTDGSVANLVTEGGEEVGVVQVKPGGDGVDWVSEPG